MKANFSMGLVLLALLTQGATSSYADDWPQWRGVGRTGSSKETSLLKDWPKDGPPLAWKITGVGHSFGTPSVAGGRIFVMGNRDKKETFRLVPPPPRLPALRRDYQSMRDMYLSEPASFDDVLATLADLERRINQVGGG